MVGLVGSRNLVLPVAYPGRSLTDSLLLGVLGKFHTNYHTHASVVCTLVTMNSGVGGYTLMGAKKEAVRRSSGVWKIVNSSGETVLASDKKDVS